MEYKKHEWLLYGACSELKTDGNPVMIAEAQASGVGVIMYKLREELIQYIPSDCGYNEILEIIKEPFCNIKNKISYQ